MGLYYAISHRNGRWVVVSSGSNPEEVYRQAVEIIGSQYAYFGDEVNSVTPYAERQLDALRVVPAEIAREKYLINVAPMYIDE